MTESKGLRPEKLKAENVAESIVTIPATRRKPTECDGILGNLMTAVKIYASMNA